MNNITRSITSWTRYIQHKPNNLGRWKLNDNINRKSLNLENLSSISKYLNKVKPKIIINAAAYTDVDKAEKKKKTCVKILTCLITIYIKLLGKN